MFFLACGVLVLVVALPSRYSSIRFWGTGSMNGGWLLVMGFVSALLALGVLMFPSCGSSTIRALWSPYSGVKVDMSMLRLL
jgi:hypothetical protein